MARDHRFAWCSQFGDAYTQLLCKTPRLQPIARALMRNMNRVRGMGMLPLNLTMTAIINEAARVEALVNKDIPIHDPRVTVNHPDFDPAFFAEIDAERKRLIDQWVKDWGAQDTFEKRAVLMGVQGMNAIIDSNEALAWDAVQATMAAMLIGLWTAFESLAQDTWTEAVNARPVPLAQRVLDPRLQKGEQAKSVSWKVISSAGFNLEKSMGTILLRERKVDFQSLETIRDAYK